MESELIRCNLCREFYEILYNEDMHEIAKLPCQCIKPIVKNKPLDEALKILNKEILNETDFKRTSISTIKIQTSK